MACPGAGFAGKATVEADIAAEATRPSSSGELSSNRPSEHWAVLPDDHGSVVQPSTKR
jgi:hypothetical protein